LEIMDVDRDSINMDLKGKGFMRVDWNHLALCRVHWPDLTMMTLFRFCRRRCKRKFP
jgi:hypothetical protein